MYRLNCYDSKNTWWILKACLILFLGSAIPLEIPADASITMARLERDLIMLKTEMMNPAIFNNKSCASFIRHYSLLLFEEGTSNYLPDDLKEEKILLDSAPHIARSIFDFRADLLEKAKDFSNKQGMTMECRNSIFRALRYSRFIEETLIEWYIKKTGVDIFPEVLKGREPVLMMRGNKGRYIPQSGDILLVRSRFSVSATIARISDEEGHFSHSALIHVDENGQVWVLESLIEMGVAAVPWEEWVKHQPVRVLVMRYRDGDTAHRVSGWLFDWVMSRKKSGKEPVPYDFNMNFSDSSELSCSELIRFAYSQATNGIVNIPKYPSSVKKLAGNKLFTDLGIHEKEIFSPSDYEIDPELSVIAEWRDYSETYGTRVQDAILSSVIFWMTDLNYQLTYEGFVQDAGAFYWRYLRPMGLGRQWVPANMTPGFFKAILALDSTTNALERALREVENHNIVQDEWGLDYKSMLVILDGIRKSDCQYYLSGRDEIKANIFIWEPNLLEERILFHQYLNTPPGTGTCRD